MKTYNNLYDKLISIDNLKLAFKKAKKGKSFKEYVKKFEQNLISELLKLKQELGFQIYTPRPLKRFILKDPKTRIIHASDFRDRVVHHALCNIIEPIIDKTFIYDSCANRKGKGNLFAIKRFDKFKRKISYNGRLVKHAKNGNVVYGYIFKADVKHYFFEVSHKVLIKIIKKKIQDDKVIWLIERILKNGQRKGMPLGNLTSQFFANVYLNELDYFVKHKLRAKYYIRYVDDFVILHKNKNILLQYRKKINHFLKTILRIELHKEKSKIHPLRNGIIFLGFRIFYYHKLLCKKNIRKLKLRLERFSKSKEDKVFQDLIKNSIEGWNAYAKWANTYNLRKRLFNFRNKTHSSAFAACLLLNLAY